MKNEHTRNMILCALFVALIIVGTFLKIPIPALPITLQVMFTTMAGLMLGGKWGCIAVSIYTLMGLLGLPVFAGGGGFSYVLRPSFGYIIGFIIGAFVTGNIAHKVSNPSYKRLFAATFVGLAIIYFCGMIYFYLISTLYLNNPIGIGALLMSCFLLVIPGDLVTCTIAVFLTKRLLPVLSKNYVTRESK